MKTDPFASDVLSTHPHSQLYPSIYLYIYIYNYIYTHHIRSNLAISSNFYININKYHIYIYIIYIWRWVNTYYSHVNLRTPHAPATKRVQLGETAKPPPGGSLVLAQAVERGLRLGAFGAEGLFGKPQQKNT